MLEAIQLRCDGKYRLPGDLRYVPAFLTSHTVDQLANTASTLRNNDPELSHVPKDGIEDHRSNQQNLFDNLSLYATASPASGSGVAKYDLFRPGGAGYWQPGYGRYNTMWNVTVLGDGGAYPVGTVSLFGGKQGPDAIIVGLHGRRPLELAYQPAPHIEWLNREVVAIPSLYGYQLTQRR